MKHLLILLISLSFCLSANGETTMNIPYGPEPSACCDNVSLTYTFLGYTPQGCCIYEVTAVNFGTCELLFFDATDLERTVPAQSSFRIEFTICDIDRKYYIGEENDQENACERIELTCD